MQYRSVPVIVIELFLVFGVVLAFAIWQFRDLAQERRRRELRERQARQDDGEASGTDDHAR